MKKYQYYVIGKRISDDPIHTDLRVFYVQVEYADGRRVPIGEPIDLTSRTQYLDRVLDIDDYERGNKEDLAEITPPPGWSVMAQWPLPDDYVPESKEVVEEQRERARQHLRERGIID